jgi:FdrA protein
MPKVVEVRRGLYRDSVALMQLSHSVAGLPGVETALIAMATPLNLDLLPGLGFEPAAGTSPDDLLVAISADDDDTLSSALGRLEELFSARESEGRSAAIVAPRTTRSALKRSGAHLAVVSVPGPHAFVEAMDALGQDADVMLFSDNVPVDQEIRLKDEAHARGLLVMGPDCGTAIVGGLGLGFANVMLPGRVGIVAASGTGAQQVCALLDAAGVGVSAVLGTGGRDLSVAVEARSTLDAMRMLDAHEGTDLIVVLSKPPAAAVAERVQAVAAQLRTPSVVGFLGRGRDDLTALTGKVLDALGCPPLAKPPHWPAERSRPPRAGALRGLFSGGTLCDEAMVIAADVLGPIRSNIPLEPEWALGPDLLAPGHLMIDFGDDRLTQGRPHPMIDSTLRLERFAREIRDPRCGVLLLDVVLGHGSDPAPAAGLVPAIEAAAEQDVAVVVSLIGTRGDPQGLEPTARQLQSAGADVYLSNAVAARVATELVRRRP